MGASAEPPAEVAGPRARGVDRGGRAPVASAPGTYYGNMRSLRGESSVRLVLDRGGTFIFRVSATKNGQAEGIRWAAEYELPA